MPVSSRLRQRNKVGPRPTLTDRLQHNRAPRLVRVEAARSFGNYPDLLAGLALPERRGLAPRYTPQVVNPGRRHLEAEACAAQVLR